MWSNVIGPTLAHIHPKVKVRTVADVDELLACEVTILKVDGTPKAVKLIGKGFLNLVDHVFWHLRFSSVKQAHAVREKANPPVSEKDWAARFEAMSTRRKEHGSSWQLDGSVVGCSEPCGGGGGGGTCWRSLRGRACIVPGG